MLKVIALIIPLLSLSLCLRRTLTVGYQKKLNADCDLMNWCDGDLRCRDYRCKPKETKDNQIPWAPEGIKCDPAHFCKEGTKCIAHRCEPLIETPPMTPNATTPLNSSLPVTIPINSTIAPPHSA